MAVTAIHPGEHLAEELQALDMSAAELARKIDVPTNRVTQILNGTRAITGDTALRLAHFFGTSAQFWLNLQSLYDLRLAQEKVGKSIKALPTLKRRASSYTHEGIQLCPCAALLALAPGRRWLDLLGWP
jgi:addiction module HigA family antidote